MTEYEIADLAISNAALIQTQGSMIQVNGSLIIDNLTLFYSLVFGYLLAAYIIGQKLTKIQTVILTVLYLVAVSYNRVSAWFIFKGFISSWDRMDEMIGTSLPRGMATRESLYLVTIFIVVSVLASLYFMWSVRNPKTE
jgi:hypothetical protein